ncbi:MAG: helix-turn-helix domain-containing protein [Clostridia bacterium]|nr:helix-turn-helix domain-containing protein [Clostridia bacterium]
MAERLLTPEEVADRLIVSPKTIRDWLREGKLKGIKTGKLWRIRECDLETFLGEERKPGETLPSRDYTRQEIREFLEADRISPEVARNVERLLNP